MENCLIKKLKGTVSDDNLLKYGDIVLTVENLTGNALFRPGPGNTAKIIGDGYFTVGSTSGEHLTEYTANSDELLYCSTGYFKIIISSGSYINPTWPFAALAFTIEDNSLKYHSEFNNFNVSQCKFINIKTISELKNCFKNCINGINFSHSNL